MLINLIKNNAPISDWCLYMIAIILLYLISSVIILHTRNISIDNETISYSNWITGKVKTYYFKDLEGYATTTKPIGMFYKEYESVLLVTNNKRVGEISSFYYSNYEDLTKEIKGLKYLGKVDNGDLESIKHKINELYK
jgi:hypothetical protein